MIYVAFAALVALALVTVTAFHLVGRLLREHARERNLILNQLLHLAGRTWQPPPTLEPVADDGEDDEIERYVASLSQLPDED